MDNQMQPTTNVNDMSSPSPAELPPDLKRGVIQTVRAVFRWCLDRLKQVL